MPKIIFLLLLQTIIVLLSNCTPQRAKSLQNVAHSVEVTYPSKQNFLDKYTFASFLQARQSNTVIFRTSGQIKSCLKDESIEVKKDTVLCSLSAKIIDLNLKAVQKKLMAARAAANTDAFSRQQDLFNKNMISRAKFEKIEAAYKKALASLAAIEAEYDLLTETKNNHTIKAPFDGIIVKNFTQSLTVVKEGLPAFQIMDLSSYNANIKVHNSVANRISPDTPVYIYKNNSGSSSSSSHSTHSTHSIAAKIKTISQTVDPISQAISIQISISPPHERKLKVGQLIEGYFILREIENATVLPSSCFLRRFSNQEGEIFLVRDKKLRLTRVQTGIEREGMVEINTLINPKTPVVVSHAAELQDGNTVSITHQGKQDVQDTQDKHIRHGMQGTQKTQDIKGIKDIQDKQN